MSKKHLKLTYEDIADNNVFEDVWLPLGDDKENDIMHLIQQNRIKKR